MGIKETDFIRYGFQTGRLTTAKEAYSIAASYALAGEPDARLRYMEMDDSKPTEKFQELHGKAIGWTLRFCAPDGAGLLLELKGKTLYWDDPNALEDCPTSEKESWEAWEEQMPNKWFYNRTIVGEWVDSPGIVSDAMERAKKDGLEGDLELWEMELEFTSDYGEQKHVWGVLIYERPVGTGYKYFYDASDGTYITREDYWIR
ncbi:MAG: hypothetical protein JSW14_03220 [Candidatus Bathyarchaeum sp.]|nr:MAG: hypothetical protein JSW14_03220 [Candidatus Bathyarchaeum sp.]